MRVVGSIDHPIYKITIFKMDTKFSLKFEIDLLELTYKMREGDIIQSVEDVKSIVTPIFLKGIDEQFRSMMKLRNQAMETKATENDFPDII